MVMIRKFNDSISEKFGIEPTKRSIEQLLDKGCIILDKDCGPTSHKAVENIKRILQIDKAGHSGTLDPQVSGVLIIGLGRATRLMEYMLKSHKSYICLMYIHKPKTTQELNGAFSKFRGVIKQTPPLISAVKRQERERTIYELNIIETAQDNQYVLFDVKCQHGTYIRKLCTDIGFELGTNAQMIELRRTKAGPKDETQSLISADYLHSLWDMYLKCEKDESSKSNLKIIEKEIREYILPMEELLQDLKKITLRDSAIHTICHGSDLGVPGVLEVDDEIKLGDELAMLSGRGELVAIGTAMMSGRDIAKKDKGAAIKTEKVFMDKEVYPKSWF